MNPTAPKRRRLALVCAIAAAVACGEVDGPGAAGTTSTSTYSTTTWDQTDDTIDPTTRTGTTQDLGTQVGSEGFWGCTIAEVNEVGPAELVPGTSEAVDKVASELAGAWLLTLDLVDRGTEEGGLWIDAPVAYALVKTDGNCGSYIEARVTGLLDRADASVAVEGKLAFAADRSSVRMAAPSVDGDVREVWGDPSSADLPFLRLDADLDADADTLAGAVGHAECLEDSCTIEELALLAGTR